MPLLNSTEKKSLADFLLLSLPPASAIAMYDQEVRGANAVPLYTSQNYPVSKEDSEILRFSAYESALQRVRNFPKPSYVLNDISVSTKPVELQGGKKMTSVSLSFFSGLVVILLDGIHKDNKTKDLAKNTLQAINKALETNFGHSLS